MSDSKHSRSATNKLFCGDAVGGGACDCGNNYQTNGAAPGTWATALGTNAKGEILYKTKGKGRGGSGQDERRFEAHHILCVSPVNGEITTNTKIDQIVAGTKWCVNDKINMMPMPMMAHSVFWYVWLKQTLLPPPFCNLPQHDWDHGAYVKEIVERLKVVAKAAERKKQAHEAESKDIKQDMDTSAKRFKTLLELRGMRSGGTHAAWSKRVCDPFSMASKGRIKSKPFPAGKLDEKIKQWRDKILGVKT